MRRMLNKGQILRTEVSGVALEVQELLGAGGQGEVYRALMNGKECALKWYYPESIIPQQRSNLLYLIRHGAPSDRFLWPIDLVSSTDSFGYVMPLREKRFRELTELMGREISATFRTLCTVGFELAHNFRLLHVAGLCYRDISWGNVFFDPRTGDTVMNTLICDNDNVGVNKESVSGILGTPMFMAPEVVRGDALPSTETDLFSLAVLLFNMLMLSHPLDGKKEAPIHCKDLVAMRWLYGEQPVFIFDPNDSSNRPVRGIHDNALIFWPLYPRFICDLFTQSFTIGLHDPNARIVEGVWRKAMVQLRDAIMYCSACQAEIFYDREKVGEGGSFTCWRCRRATRLPPRLRVGNNIIMLNHDIRLYPHHLDSKRPFDFSQPLAEMSHHPTDLKIWGLKNLSQTKWVMTHTDGTNREISPGRSVPLLNGVRIHFGDLSGEVKQ